MSVAIVSGALANKAGNGGNAWSRLTWVRGLDALGLDVWFVEQLHDATDLAAVDYFAEVMSAFGLDGRSGLLRGDGSSAWGSDRAELLEVAASADLLLNIGGHLRDPELKRAPRVRAYLDDDPGYTQIWALTTADAAGLEGHDRFFTFGANVGGGDCSIPTAGIDWVPVRPPVGLDDWPISGETAAPRLTTVGSWRGAYGPVEYEGVRYDQKAHQFRRFAALPAAAPAGYECELALDIHPAETPDLDLLRRHGWRLVDPTAVARTPQDFHRYVTGSWAEFSAAQGMYVTSANGWFSDRTTRYLAAGRPAIVQRTGWERAVPSGEGLVGFATLDEAATAVRRIARDYEHHRAAARELAASHFDAATVIGRVLDQCGVNA